MIFLRLRSNGNYLNVLIESGSWHGTSPIFAADYQPWSAAQLRKVLPFPSSSSGSGSSGLEPPSTSTSASTSIPGLPSTPSRKQKQQDVDGDVENLAPGTTSASTPVASSSSTSNNNAGDQATPTPGRGRTRVRAGSISVSGSARDVTPTPIQNPANVSASAGGFNASATRVYRLATAGADSCVRVGPGVCLVETRCASRVVRLLTPTSSVHIV